jgi:putative tryptophan/tyrosine transport system substrate-binding protein
MRRRDLLSMMAGAALVPRLAQAEAPKRRIGFLETTTQERNAANLAAFRTALAGLGFDDGKLVIDYRTAEGRSENFVALAAELIRDKPEIIVTRGTPAALAVKSVTNTIPIVMAASGDPLRLVASLAKPDGNVTGLSALVAELEGKRIETLRELKPGLSRIAVLTNLDNPVGVREWDEVKIAAQKLGLQVRLLAVESADQIEAAFATQLGDAEALLVTIDTLTQTNAQRIAALAAAARLPAIYASREFVDAGGLVFFGVDYVDLYRRAATYVAKILKGAQPADLPVEQAEKFDLIINLKAAKALGLAVPQMLLARADEVIE